MITQSSLKEILDYSPETGIFTWKVKPSPRVYIGDIAGCIINDYIRIRINKKLYPAHRLAFLYMTGRFPENHVDHINHLKNDNRWVNVRDVTHDINHKNRYVQSNNTSGVQGVFWHKKHKTNQVYITISKVQKYIGSFKDRWDAICARKSVEYKYGFHKNHGMIKRIELMRIK